MGGALRSWLRDGADSARATDEPTPLPSRGVRVDAVVAAVALSIALAAAAMSYHGVGGVKALFFAVLTAAPLAARRRYPATAFLVVLAAAVAGRDVATDVTFVLVVVAAYSAAVYGRHRGAAQLSLVPAGVVVAAAYWAARPAQAGVPEGSVPVQAGPARILLKPSFPGTLPRSLFLQGAPWRLAGVLVLVSLATITVVAAVSQASDRIRRLRVEHATATRRALEAERARIASELHDVVTHNVSVMIVQAGAARKVLDQAPGEARAALLAVESSGRAAMAELRHMLDLLSQAESGAADGAAGGAANSAAQSVGGAATSVTVPGVNDLSPQPGIGQLHALVERVAAAGLPVGLQLGDLPRNLPPGLDLAAYRVVQEALTNVIKHAGKPPTTVRADCRSGTLVLEIQNEGPPIPAAAPAAISGSGRGLLGLRERLALYGGQLAAGPIAGGGWLVRAHIPVDQAATSTTAASGGLSRLATTHQ